MWTQAAQWVGGSEKGPEGSGSLKINSLLREAETVSGMCSLPPCFTKTKHGS